MVRHGQHTSASRYPSSPTSANIAEMEKAVWKGAVDLTKAREKWSKEFRVSAGEVEHVVPGLTQLDGLTNAAITKEVDRLLGGGGARGIEIDRAALQGQARAEAAWARTWTLERNPAIVARFAVEAAYDSLFRYQVQAVLNTPVPHLWFHHRPQGEAKMKMRFVPEDSGHLLAIPEQQYGALWINTQGVLDRERQVLTVHPYERLRPSQLWALDPIRPPISAVRLAAKLIQGLGAPMQKVTWSPEWVSYSDEAWEALPEASIYQGHSLRWVKAINMGHTAGVQALSLFLDAGHVVVHESNLVHVQAHYGAPQQFGAVVLNIPDLRGWTCLKTISELSSFTPQRTLDRWQTESLWRTPAGLQVQDLEGQVQKALEQVRLGGVLIILGDAESGSTHGADKVIEGTRGFERRAIAGGHEMVMVNYETVPWAPFHMIPPTARVISCWKRTSGVTTP